MYEGGKGAGILATGSVILPSTAGNHAMSTVATITIVVGAIILITTIARFVVKKATKN